MTTNPISSILDTDLYKLTMGQAVLKRFPGKHAHYRFINRDPTRRFNARFVERLRERIDEMGELELSTEEMLWLRQHVPFLELWYVDWLGQFRFDPIQVSIVQDEDGFLVDIAVHGPWETAIYWEVPLLALISETYFELEGHDSLDNSPTVENAEEKILRLSARNVKWAEFGTRRRISYVEHDAVVEAAARLGGGVFIGTSNVHLSMRHLVTPIGTMAHEWVMGVGALMGLRYANRYSMEEWNTVYRGELGIALTDTYGSAAFFGQFDKALAKLFDGVRQDSGDPRRFIHHVIEHYEALGIDPRHKTIIFSDSLDVDRCIELKDACDVAGINSAFGIGTNMTNDDTALNALNIVVKLWGLDGVPVAKLSDDSGKATGDPDAIAEAKWVFRGEPLV